HAAQSPAVPPGAPSPARHGAPPSAAARLLRGFAMLKGFKQFLLRGNVLDLAVAVVIGGAFGAVVTALVKDLLTPLIAAIIQVPDFSAMTFTVNGSKFLIGEFVNALISFLLIAFAVYLFVIVPVNTLV